MTQKSKFLLTSVCTSVLTLSLGMSPVFGSEVVVPADDSAVPSNRPATPPVAVVAGDVAVASDVVGLDATPADADQLSVTSSVTDVTDVPDLAVDVSAPAAGDRSVTGSDTASAPGTPGAAETPSEGASEGTTAAPTPAADEADALPTGAPAAVEVAAVEPVVAEPAAVEPVAEPVAAADLVVEPVAASAAAPAAAAVPEVDAHAEELKAALVHAIAANPWDENGDGHVSLTEFWHHIKRMFKKSLDVNGDGEVDAKDFVAEGKKVYGNVKSIFDVDHDGHVEFTEIFLGAQNALRSAEGVVAYVRGLSEKIQTSPYFALLPANIKGPLDDLLGLMNQAADETSRGIDIGETYVGRINAALESIQGQIKHLRDGSMNLDQFIQARKEIFAYLEIVKGWEKTGDNARLIHDIEEQLAKEKAPAA